MTNVEDNKEGEERGKTAAVPGEWASWILLYLKGMAMGLGDSVPGISGGTIAVITNIYDRLIYSIRAVDLDALKLVLKGRIAEAWQHINGNFLLLLALGILSGLLLSANTVLFLLAEYYEVLMAFFIGLILASTWLLRSQFRMRGPLAWLLLLVGLAVTMGIAFLDARQADLALWYVFVCGAIAICAMILPGLSGAFILILLGIYEAVLRALLALEWQVILVFMLGCVTGLLAFSRLLALTLKRYHDLSYSFITGLLLGSLLTLWPWQRVVSEYIDSEGQVHSLSTRPVWPLNYEELAGQDPMLTLCLVSALGGFGLVILLHGVFNHQARD